MCYIYSQCAESDTSHNLEVNTGKNTIKVVTLAKSKGLDVFLIHTRA